MSKKKTAADAQRRIAVRSQSNLGCAVSSCARTVQGLSRYCRFHDQRNQTYGHPLGTTFRHGQLKPFKREAALFIQKQRGHPGIEAAIQWLDNWIQEAPDPGVIHARSTARARSNRLLDRMRRGGVTGEDALAIVAGMYAAREFQPRGFKSDRHWNHQLAVRFIRSVPPPHSVRSNGESYSLQDRIGVGVRDFMADRLTKAVGPLCLRIARELAADSNLQDQPPRLPGLDKPFN